MRAMCQCGDRQVHRKASRYSMCQYINLSSVPSVGQRIGSLFTTDRTDLADLLVEERDQKVSVGLGGIPPWAFRHRLCSRRVLAAPYGATPSPALQDLLSPHKAKWLQLAVQNRLPWSHNDILRLVRGTPVLWISILPRIGRIEWICLRILGTRQKQHKPLAVDARCLLRAIDAVSV